MILKIKINIVIYYDITEYTEKEVIIKTTSIDLEEIKTEIGKNIKDNFFISDITLINK